MWNADLHWGAHAPPRVVFGALAEDSFPSGLSQLTQNISGEGAGSCTRGRVRSQNASTAGSADVPVGTVNGHINACDVCDVPLPLHSHANEDVGVPSRVRGTSDTTDRSRIERAHSLPIRLNRTGSFPSLDQSLPCLCRQISTAEPPRP